MKYEDRIELTNNPTAKRLFELMAEKQTNLAIAADVTDPNELISIVQAVGDEICVLKTHIDVVTDFSKELIDELVSLKEKHNFLIFEDWADITNAHVVPGPGIIEGLRDVGLPKGRGLLLLAEMSSAGNLATGEYTKQAIEWAEEYNDFVIGFIGMKKMIRAFSTRSAW